MAQIFIAAGDLDKKSKIQSFCGFVNLNLRFFNEDEPVAEDTNKKMRKEVDEKA